MKNAFKIICAFFVIAVHAQQNERSKSATFNLNEVAMVSIEPNNSSVVLNLAVPDFAGESVKLVTSNNSKWINFTSAISRNSPPRNLSIKIEDGNVPAGIHLKLNTSNYTGNGKGQLGIQNTELTLNNTLQPLVSNIGGAYTGKGINNGYKLTYYLEIYDYKQLDIENSEVLSISITLTDF